MKKNKVPLKSGTHMLKKITSALTAITLLAGTYGVFAENDDSSDTSGEDLMQLMNDAAMEEGIDLSGFSVPYSTSGEDENIDAQSEEAEAEEHEETITEDIELDEESEILLDDDSEDGISPASDSTDNSELWKTLFEQRFGDDYLQPNGHAHGGTSISGNTNRLVIEETDLSLPGKNGLDLNITRKYDSQYYHYAYSRAKMDYVDKEWNGKPKRNRIGYRQIEGGLI